jgi:hypothetical protein
MPRVRKFDTTLGDLIVALTDEAGRYVGDDREKYRVVAVMLSGVLKNSPAPSSVRPAPLTARRFS